MKLPSKVTPYKKSTLALLPDLLAALKKGDMEPIELYKKMRNKYSSVSEFIDALDCLKALQKVELTEKGVLTYVE